MKENTQNIYIFYCVQSTLTVNRNPCKSPVEVYNVLF